MSRSTKLTHATRVQRIRELLEARDHVTIEELVREFGRCRRTVYYDLTALQDAGVPIYSEPGPSGEAHWKLHPIARRRPSSVRAVSAEKDAGAELLSLELVLDPEHARALLRRLPGASRLAELPTGHLRLTVAGSGTSELLLWLLAHTASIEVMSLPEPREHLPQRRAS